MNPPVSPTLKRVLAGQLCTGCGLCAGLSDGAIAMETVEPGYSRPEQSRAISAAAEQAIAEACPGAKVAGWEGQAPHMHWSWGPWFRTMTGHATDPEVRFAGSSGGALSGLLIHALDQGLIHSVLHIEADPEKPTRNRLCWSRDASAVIANAGSRYSASAPLEDINAALDSGERFAFVGKPCDVSALRQLATVDPRVDRQVPLMLSFFCGGMPSHAGADRIIRAMDMEPSQVVRFRYRGNGWPGLTIAEDAEGRQATMRYEDSWGKHLSREVQFRCKICPDAVGGVADIACADAWYGGEAGYPSFEEEDGRSLIMSRTGRGNDFLSSAMEAGAIEAAPLAIDEIDLMQPAQARRKRVVRARTAACTVLGKPVPVMKGLRISEAAGTSPVAEQLKNFSGTMWRIIKGQR